MSVCQWVGVNYTQLSKSFTLQLSHRFIYLDCSDTSSFFQKTNYWEFFIRYQLGSQRSLLLVWFTWFAFQIWIFIYMLLHFLSVHSTNNIYRLCCNQKSRGCFILWIPSLLHIKREIVVKRRFRALVVGNFSECQFEIAQYFDVKVK